MKAIHEIVKIIAPLIFYGIVVALMYGVLVTFLCGCNPSYNEAEPLIGNWDFYQSIDETIHWSGGDLKLKDNHIYDWKSSTGYWENDTKYIWVDRRYEYFVSEDMLTLLYPGPSVKKYSYKFKRR